MTETIGIQQILNAVFMIIYPLLYVVIAITGILLFRAEKRHYNLCITIGGGLSLLAAMAHLMYFLPGVGLMNNREGDPVSFVQNLFLFTGAVNAIALALIAYGILMHAWAFSKTRLNATLAEDHRN